MLAMGLIFLGIVSRLIPHAWNFTPLLAVALFSGAVLPKRQAIVLPLMTLLVTDAILGWHVTMPFTWGSVVLIVSIGFWLHHRRSVSRVFLGAIVAAVLFFIISNFGSWLFYYSRTPEGLLECYTLAIPFFRNTLVSTVGYSLVLFGVYEFSFRTFKESRYARLLFPNTSLR